MNRNNIQYRINVRTGDKISEIGMGTAYIVESEGKEAVRTVRHAFECGINYFDLAAADGTAFSTFGEALSDVRNKVMYQLHFGADYSNITYGWTLNLDTVKHSVDRQLKELKKIISTTALFIVKMKAQIGRNIRKMEFLTIFRR